MECKTGATASHRRVRPMGDAMIDVYRRESPLVLLDPQLLPEDRYELARAVPALSASGVELAVLAANPVARHRAQRLLANVAMFGRQATSPTLATNSRRSHADSQ